MAGSNGLLYHGTDSPVRVADVVEFIGMGSDGVVRRGVVGAYLDSGMVRVVYTYGNIGSERVHVSALRLVAGVLDAIENSAEPDRSAKLAARMRAGLITPS